jgi:hypothetical protein
MGWNPPKLTLVQILAWADSLRERTGRWPRVASGPVTEGRGEDWRNINIALRDGTRGLPGGDSLAQLLARRRRVRNRKALPPLTVRQILSWADAFHDRTGRWPQLNSGWIGGGAKTTWSAVDTALRDGCRGLRCGSSLAELLARRRGVRIRPRPPRLTVSEILAWAQVHRQRTGRWPTQHSGSVADVPGETWNAIEQALWNGVRGLTGKTTLSRLLHERLGVPTGQKRLRPRAKKG